jgi:transcriptional regulator with XRE-family HTH domain
MSFKDNYLKLTKKFSKGPYSLEKEGISRGSIDSIMRGSTPSVDTAYKIAKALGIMVEELVTGKSIEENVSQNVVSNTYVIYKDSEEEHLVDKLIEILRNSDEEHKEIITNIINILCGEKMWVKEGRNERRKKPVLLHGKLERRIKIHVYS